MPENKRKKIKKFIIPSEGDEKGIVVFGGKSGRDSKVIFKVLEKGRNEHFTMVFDNNGNIDFHKTIEGKIKSYTPLLKGTIDFQKIIEDFIGTLKKKLISIDPEDTIYHQHIILIPKSAEKLMEFFDKYYISGEKMIVPNDKEAEIISKSMADYFRIDYFPEITNYSFGLAFLIDPETEEFDYLINKNNAYFLLRLKEEEFGKIIQKHLQLKRVDV